MFLKEKTNESNLSRRKCKKMLKNFRRYVPLSKLDRNNSWRPNRPRAYEERQTGEYRHSSLEEHSGLLWKAIRQMQLVVPQGLVLGPCLFLFYINNLSEDLNCTVRLFADDTIAYLVVVTKKDCCALQKDLHKLADWEPRWKMEFHAKKCQVLTITRKKNTVKYNYVLHGQVLTQVQLAKYLGCTINIELDWGEHIHNSQTRQMELLLSWGET